MKSFHSTKIAMKMSRVSDKNKELLEEKAGTSESAMSEDDDDEEDADGGGEAGLSAGRGRWRIEELDTGVQV